eukprot:COSAG02_NODE_2113_length_9800_cov_53.566643_5_plen_68_part_00
MHGLRNQFIEMQTSTRLLNYNCRIRGGWQSAALEQGQVKLEGETKRSDVNLRSYVTEILLSANVRYH